MDLFELSTHIYFSKTREYFKEVMSSYTNENYRSAIVMLYSVCICDLLFKLQELNDMYNDAIAQSIIERIEREQKESKSKSSWEKILVDNIWNKTKLLDSEAYANLCHLYDYRNLSAHPALNGELNLISPKKEIVAGFIRTSLETILIKPSIFIKDITKIMSEDLNEKRGYILHDKNAFKTYIKSKYLDRMPDLMYQKIFGVFWRFTFRLINADCKNNRIVNYHLLSMMYKIRKDIIDSEIRNNPDKYEISIDDSIEQPIIYFLSNHPSVYPLLSGATKSHIETIIQGNKAYFLLSWFTSNKSEHIKNIISNKKYIYITDTNYIDHFVKEYEDEGLLDDCLEYLIMVVGDASQYVNAGNRVENYILPYLPKMKFKHFELIFRSIENCQSLRDNYYIDKYCRSIWKYASSQIPKSYDMTQYPHFKVPESDED